MRFGAWSGVLGVVFLGSSCGVETADEKAAQDTSSSAQSQLVRACLIPVPKADRSLFVTDATALAKFPLQAVLNQIVSTGSNDGQTALGVYQQLVDTLNTKALGATSGPHCDDVKTNGVPSIDGFPIQCPRQEGTLAKTNPFVAGPNQLVPVGLVNRFDLAPSNGANCGQYRIVYAKESGVTNGFDRFLMIFEATLPNPKPSAGLAGCLPVAQFWDNLTDDNDANDRAAQLKKFYFTGLTAANGEVFSPVIRAAHYGFGGGTNTGQIRANMFMFQTGFQEWELREFRLSQQCATAAGSTTSTCHLTAKNTGVQANPFGGLFARTDATGLAFQQSFLGQVQALAAATAPAISFVDPVSDNAGESDEQDSSNDYAFQAQGNTSFQNAITAKLAALKRTDLTATNILDRATTQSCAGCHELSNVQNLGAGLIWPASNGFTQIDERSTLSSALQLSFLPARANVLFNFLRSQCIPPPVQPVLPEDGLTIGGSAVGAAN